MRVPIIDGDIILYEIGFAAESYWKHLNKEKGVETEDPPPFTVVEETLINRINHIVALSEATEKPEFYFTGKTNFRNEIAVTTPYKDRAGFKPFHYYNVKAYIQGMWEYYQQEGLEADDLLGIRMTEDKDVICCSRDKDLLQLSGWHYQWELGNQPQFGPHLVNDYGKIEVVKGKIRGYGLKFFLSQLITGDSVDSIPGLPDHGPVAAFKTLEATTTYLDGLEAVVGAYNSAEKDITYLTEQAQLLWMVRELQDGKPVMWEYGKGY